MFRWLPLHQKLKSCRTCLMFDMSAILIQCPPTNSVSLQFTVSLIVIDVRRSKNLIRNYRASRRWLQSTVVHNCHMIVDTWTPYASIERTAHHSAHIELSIDLFVSVLCLTIQIYRQINVSKMVSCRFYGTISSIMVQPCSTQQSIHHQKHQ